MALRHQQIGAVAEVTGAVLPRTGCHQERVGRYPLAADGRRTIAGSRLEAPRVPVAGLGSGAGLRRRPAPTR